VGKLHLLGCWNLHPH